MRVEENPDPTLALAFYDAEPQGVSARDVERLWQIPDAGHFVARNGAGAPVGVASCVAYRDGGVAFVSGMLVEAGARRRGVGRALLNACVAHAEALGVRSVGLDATEEALPLYARAGFRAVATSRHWVGGPGPVHVEGAPPASIHPISLSEVFELLAYDRPRFGANRIAALTALLHDRPERAFLARDRRTGDVVGHVLGHEAMVGPLVADDPAVAMWLLRAALRAGTPPKLVVPDASGDFCDLLRDVAFAPDTTCTRMWRGPPVPTSPDVRAFASFALG